MDQEHLDKLNFTSAGLLSILIWGIFLFIPQESSFFAPEIHEGFHSIVNRERPEFYFFTALTFLPLLLFILLSLKPKWIIKPRITIDLNIVAAGMVFFGLYFFLNSDFWVLMFPYDETLTFTAFTLTLALIMFRKSSEIVTRPLTILFFLVLLFIVAIHRVKTLEMVTVRWWWTDHFQTFFAPISHMARGTYSFQEFIPQYGYAGTYLTHFLAPARDPVFTLMLIMSILLVACVLICYRIFRSEARTQIVPALFLGCFTLLIGYHFLASRNHIHDIYLQYFPLRMWGPCLSLFLIHLWLKNKTSLIHVILSGLTLGFSLTWNIDSGIPATVAFVIIAGLTCKSKEQWRKLSGICSVIIFYVIAFGIYYDINPRLIFKFQTIYLSAGLSMLPAPKSFHPWHFMAAFYIVSLFTDISRLGIKHFLSLLGLLLFSYYGGRSHDMVLLACYWPFLILLFLNLDLIISDWINQPESSGRALLVSLLMFPVMIIALSLIQTVKPSLAKAMKNDRLIKEVSFLEKRAGELMTQQVDCELLSGFVGIYKHLGVPSARWNGPFISELVLKKDYEVYLNYLSNQNCLIIDEKTLGDFPGGRILLSEIEKLTVEKFYLK